MYTQFFFGQNILSARGIPVDPCYPLCRQGPESICHMLFHCPSAKEAWERSSIPLPPAGFSPTSVFLNLHYLLACSKKSSVDPKLRFAFPWIFWHIWKNRNLFCFEQRSNSAEIILSRALEEASVWLQLNAYVPADPPAMELEVEDSYAWKKLGVGKKIEPNRSNRTDRTETDSDQTKVHFKSFS